MKSAGLLQPQLLANVVLNDWRGGRGQRHNVRGFVSGTLGKKLKMKIDSFKTEKGDRAYRVEG